MGGAFLVVASLLAATYTVFLGDVGVRLIALAVAFVFVASMLGKLTGILIAVERLAVIRRRLSGHVASVVDAKHRPAARGA